MYHIYLSIYYIEAKPRHRVDQLTARGEIISSETPRLLRVEARHPFPFGPCVVTYHVLLYHRIITLHHDRPTRRRQWDTNS